MRNQKKAGFLSATLIFVLVAAIGVIILLVTLMRSNKFETIQLNLSEGQQLREDQLRELGQLEEDLRIDGKIVLVQRNIEKYNKEKNISCDYELNTSTPKETAEFKSKDKAIEFSLPYSDEWGSDEFTLMPYDEEGETVYFGPLLEMSNCAWQRAYSVLLHETKPTAEILADLNMRNIQDEWAFVKVKDRDVIRFVEKNSLYENCLSTRMYLLGTDYDYEFIVTCSDDLENDFGFLEQILSTVKFD